MTAPNLSTYGGYTQDIGVEGAIADSSNHTIVSRVNSAAIAIQLGNLVAETTGAGNDQNCKAPTADGDKLIGFAVRHHAQQSTAAGVTDYPQNSVVSILKTGAIYVLCTETFNKGDGVISKTAGNGTVGSTTGGAAGAGRIAVSAVFENSGSAGTVGRVRANIL
jgi:hypothetical protein